MSSQSESQFVSLRINYRASPAVIDACNALFSSDPWFGTGGRITFSNTESAPARLTKFRLEKDPTGTRACVAVKASVETPRMAKRAFQLFMAEEIQTLLSGMEIGEGQKASRLLNAGDIAVLVRNRTDGEFVEKVLEASNIPCSFYKKSDLFGSRESHQLLLLLSWVADPGNPWKMRKALLTDFFRFSLNQVEDSSPGEDVRTLLFHWADLASRRAWPAFFRSIVEDSAFLLGFADSLFGIDGERAALEQIIETLTTEALTRRLDLSGVLDALVRLSAGQGAAEGEDLRRQETEEHRVQIMTIHAAKGLEFPVVFVAGGLTKLMPHMLSYFEYYEETDGRAQRVFDLRKRNKAIEALHLANEVEEDKRLYYVAFTRAALKLYVPIFQYAKSGTYLGPGSRFIREAVEAAQTSGAITVLNVDEAGREVASGARSDSSVPTARRSEPPKREGDVVSIRPGADIPSVSHRMVHVRSYSSIARAMDVVSNATDSAGAHEGRDLDGSAAVEDADDTDSIDSIFRGAAAGNLFHAVLENVDFTEFRESGKLPGLARSLHSTRILNEALDLYGITPEDARYKAARQGAFDVVDRTLNTPLALADGLCLSQLEEKDRIHELEFFLKTDVMHG
ncbi:MAG: hypothetical protein HY042_05040, partial [Spirochaetia bacterium]|nr:hypothetical protein [Spirochaetia bacterium]